MTSGELVFIAAIFFGLIFLFSVHWALGMTALCILGYMIVQYRERRLAERLASEFFNRALAKGPEIEAKMKRERDRIAKEDPSRFAPPDERKTS